MQTEKARQKVGRQFQSSKYSAKQNKILGPVEIKCSLPVWAYEVANNKIATINNLIVSNYVKLYVVTYE
eukprot:TRINITY_DN4450_c0_g1_i1.p1 TRINITY_DN4450_c0_g1~~TRINITY_DN4450_c0_g1_i1.p1  ORF type:complete len:69 (-),score=3.76 TRINITY_DN4450_c0_g1_i1:111-317(-)